MMIYPSIDWVNGNPVCFVPEMKSTETPPPDDADTAWTASVDQESTAVVRLLMECTRILNDWAEPEVFVDHWFSPVPRLLAERMTRCVYTVVGMGYPGLLSTWASLGPSCASMHELLGSMDALLHCLVTGWLSIAPIEMGLSLLPAFPPSKLVSANLESRLQHQRPRLSRRAGNRRRYRPRVARLAARLAEGRLRRIPRRVYYRLEGHCVARLGGGVRASKRSPEPLRQCGRNPGPPVCEHRRPPERRPRAL